MPDPSPVPNPPLWLRSDNAAGVSPEILSALAVCNNGVAPGYGADNLSCSLDARFSELFGRPAMVFAVPSGTAANALSLASLAGPGNRIACHHEAHVFDSEEGATAQFSSGAQFTTLGGDHGRIDVDALARELERSDGLRPVALTLTQLTEAGTAYGLDHLAALASLARSAGLAIHMDGARLANALARLDVSAAQLVKTAAVDVLSFGATKNGAMYADAVVFFEPRFAQDFKVRLRRAGHDLSKTRFMAAQLLAMLENDLWLRNAQHANAMATRIAAALAAHPDAQLVHPVEGNIVFVALQDRLARHLSQSGHALRAWGQLADGRAWYRIVASFATSATELAAFEQAIRGCG